MLEKLKAKVSFCRTDRNLNPFELQKVAVLKADPIFLCALVHTGPKMSRLVCRHSRFPNVESMWEREVLHFFIEHKAFHNLTRDMSQMHCRICLCTECLHTQFSCLAWSGPFISQPAKRGRTAIPTHGEVYSRIPHSRKGFKSQRIVSLSPCRPNLQHGRQFLLWQPCWSIVSLFLQVQKSLSGWPLLHLQNSRNFTYVIRHFCKTRADYA